MSIGRFLIIALLVGTVLGALPCDGGDNVAFLNRDTSKPSPALFQVAGLRLLVPVCVYAQVSASRRCLPRHSPPPCSSRLVTHWHWVVFPDLPPGCAPAIAACKGQEQAGVCVWRRFYRYGCVLLRHWHPPGMVLWHQCQRAVQPHVEGLCGLQQRWQAHMVGRGYSLLCPRLPSPGCHERLPFERHHAGEQCHVCLGWRCHHQGLRVCVFADT